MKNIDITCKCLSIFFRLVTFALPIFVSYLMLFNLELAFNIGFFSKVIGFEAIKNIDLFSISERVYILAMTLVDTVFTIVTFYFLSKLFRNYSQKKYFELNTIKIIKKIASFILLTQLISPFYQAAITYFLTIHNDVGNHLISISVGSDSIGFLIIGIVLFVAAHITEQARKIQLEQALTI